MEPNFYSYMSSCLGQGQLYLYNRVRNHSVYHTFRKKSFHVPMRNMKSKINLVVFHELFLITALLLLLMLIIII